MFVDQKHLQVSRQISFNSWIPKVLGILPVVVGSLLSLSQAGLALSETELYQLCSKYPHNSQCEGYEIPIPLSRREGQEGACALDVAEEALTEKCKILLNEEKLIVYLEEGDSISLLDNERRTTEFEINVTSISALAYREDDDINEGRMLRNVLLFGVLGALLTQPDEVAQVEISFSETMPMDAEPNVTGNLIFETDQQEGSDMRQELEQLTGLFAHSAP